MKAIIYDLFCQWPEKHHPTSWPQEPIGMAVRTEVRVYLEVLLDAKLSTAEGWLASKAKYDGHVDSLLNDSL